MVKSFDCEYAKLMYGVEDEDSHIYVKPQKFTGKFFADNNSKDMEYISINKFIEALAKVAPELIVCLKTWDGSTSKSRITNSKHYYQIILTSNGMIFNTVKEAKQYIKDNPRIKGGHDGAKKMKCTPMTVSVASEEIKNTIKTINSQKTEE